MQSANAYSAGAAIVGKQRSAYRSAPPMRERTKITRRRSPEKTSASNERSAKRPDAPTHEMCLVVNVLTTWFRQHFDILGKNRAIQIVRRSRFSNGGWSEELWRFGRYRIVRARCTQLICGVAARGTAWKHPQALILSEQHRYRRIRSATSLLPLSFSFSVKLIKICKQ